MPNHGLSATGLSTYDTNQDGQPRGTELTSLNVWADFNENSLAETEKILSLSQAWAVQIHSTYYNFYIQGNSRYVEAPVAAPGKPNVASQPADINLVETIPASNCRTLRNTETLT